jgi:hypothetical protein
MQYVNWSVDVDHVVKKQNGEVVDTPVDIHLVKVYSGGITFLITTYEPKGHKADGCLYAMHTATIAVDAIIREKGFQLTPWSERESN